ncbi:MAG: NAD-dependent deacylase [Candidatus Aminicenantes bacterium]|nr:MAG: NAD-dependent deacylase [Candidatus Aminicenantes bacterium]
MEIEPLIELLLNTTRVAVLTGAGISAECGIPTFRGEGGLWKKHRPEELATPTAFSQNPNLVWEWYDWRRGIIGSKDPNPGHEVLAQWEKVFPSFSLVTQNIDGLHQKSGSTKVLELHGNIWKFRCTEEGTITDNHDVPLKKMPPLCEACGALLRPHVVWFGESLSPTILQKAFLTSASCEAMFVIGTSAVVQPAASLPLQAANAGAKIVEINPDPTPLTSYADFSFRGKSGEILPAIDKEFSRRFKEAKE